MEIKLQYTLFIKHFIEKKLQNNYYLYIDEKTRNILDFTNTTNDNPTYQSVYKKVSEIERKNAKNPEYLQNIWERIAQSQIIKTMLFYYNSLVEYHYNNDIYYEENQTYLTNKLFTKNTFQYLGNTSYTKAIQEEFLRRIIKYDTTTIIHSSVHLQTIETQKSYTCISKYYPYFFEYSYHVKKFRKPQSLHLPLYPTSIQSPEEKIRKSEEETLEYIRCWMQ